MQSQYSTTAKKFVPGPMSFVALCFAFVPVVLLVKGVYGFGSIIKSQVKEAEKHQYAQEVSASESLQITCSSDPIVLPEAGFTPTGIFIPKNNVLLPIQVVDGEYSSVKLAPSQAYTPVAYSIVRNADDPTTASSLGVVASDSPTGLESIKKLAKRDKIQVFSKEYTAEFEINEVNTPYTMKENSFLPKSEPTLTVVTAVGTMAKKNYIIRARLVSVKANCYDSTH